MKHIQSCFSDETELISSILKIHNDGVGIELDPTYSRGAIYRGIDKPKYRFDLNASEMGYDAKDANAEKLPIQSGSIKSMLIDPPFLFGSRGEKTHGKISKIFTMYKDWEELEKSYRGMLKEAYRVLDKNGMLVFKCQDYTDGKTTMTHCYVWMWAMELGFYPKDIAVLNLPMVKVYNGNLNQRHLRKSHCYFYVFIKKRGAKYHEG